MALMADMDVSNMPEYKVLVQEMATDMLKHQANNRSDYYIDSLRKFKPYKNDLDKLLRFNGLVHQAIGYIQGSNDATNKMLTDFNEDLKKSVK